MAVGKVGKLEKLTLEGATDLFPLNEAITHERAADLAPLLAELPFGRLLQWLVERWGARPDGRRKLWTYKEFGGAISARAEPQNAAHTVSNWVHNKNLPRTPARIQSALFGNNQDYDPWRPILHDALNSARAERRPRPTRKIPRPRSHPPFIGVPPSIGPSFIGREPQLTTIHGALQRNRRAIITPISHERPATVRRAVVPGMPGVGKTTVAAEYAHRYRDAYAGVLWCRAENQDVLLPTLVEFGISQGVLPADLSAALHRPDVDRTPGDAHHDSRHLANAAQHILQWLSQPRNKPWLLVYDNVKEPKHIKSFLPGKGCVVLITSRFFAWRSWADEVQLDVFTIEDAVAYLQHQAARTDEAGARQLANTLGRLPLALSHAAAICRRSQRSFAAFATNLDRLINEVPPGVPYSRTVLATFTLALNDAVARYPEAEYLMTFLAHCAPERIPLYLIKTAFQNNPSTLEALDSLIDLSLVRQDPLPNDIPAITVHPLVQAVARSSSDYNSASGAISRLFAALSRLFPDEWSFQSQICVVLIPHVLAARIALQFADVQPDLFVQAAIFLLEHHPRDAPHTDEQRQLVHAALEASQRSPLLATKFTADRFRELARLLARRGALDSARVCDDRGLAILERVLGPNHPSLPGYLRWHARLLRVLGDFSKARLLLERSIAICEMACGDNRSHNAAALMQLAALSAQQDECFLARHLYQRALSIYRELVASDLSYANDFCGLGMDAPEDELTQYEVGICESAFAALQVLRPHAREADELCNQPVDLMRVQISSLRALCDAQLSRYEGQHGRHHLKTVAARQKFTQLLKLISHN